MSSVQAINTLDADMYALGRAARQAAACLAKAPAQTKNAALMSMAGEVRANVGAILAANADDVALAKSQDRRASFIDRLTLTPQRVEMIAESLQATAELDDPVGQEIARWTRPNGLDIARVRTPIGVIGIIYESRPNVTADAGSLCLKSGNAAILRAGSDSFQSARAIAACLRRGLVSAGLPEAAISVVPSIERSAVGMMLQGLDGAIDLIVPRGGKSLVERVQQEARVPVFAHLEGVCHVYIDASADTAMATAIAVNAKMRRTGICGAAETLLIDRAGVDRHLKPVIQALMDAGCAVRGDAETVRACGNVAPADEQDWLTEYLDAVISVRIVNGVDDAMDHIRRYGSAHTDSIVANDDATAEKFLTELDSALVMHNASTQFADGGEFGFGAEIGIATGKLHARGPVGPEQLTTFKYQVRGSGQTRP